MWLGLLLLTALAVFIISRSKVDQKHKARIILLVVLGLTLRIILARMDYSFVTDLNTFKYWSDYLASAPFSGFYSGEFFADYPPGYLYVLWFVAKIGALLGLPVSSLDYTVLIMLPSMICDIALAVVIYLVATKRFSCSGAFLAASAFLFNPAVLINSSVWGQVDIFYTGISVLSLYCIYKKQYVAAFLLFALNITVKPQALILSPIYLYSIFRILKDRVMSFGRLMGLGLGCIALIFVVFLPFTDKFNFMPILNQYVSTLTQYPYATLNAYNFYALFGANRKLIDEIFVVMPYSFFGTLSLILITVTSFYVLSKQKKSTNFFYTGAFLTIMTFMFSVKMHERYIYPAIAFLLMAYLLKPNKHMLILFGGFSITLFLNCLDILLGLYISNPPNIFQEWFLPYVSFVNVVLTVYMIYYMVKHKPYLDMDLSKFGKVKKSKIK